MSKSPEEKKVYLENPFGDNVYSFSLNREPKIGLILRLIRNRSKALEFRGNYFRKLKILREENNIDKLDEEIKKLEASDSFDEKEAEAILEKYPEEIINCQNKAIQYTDEAFNIGLKICSLVLKPDSIIPKEFDDNLALISSLISNEEEIEAIISFFLESFDSTTNFQLEGTLRIE